MRSSPEARRRVTLGDATASFFLARSQLLCFLLCLTWLSICAVPLFAQVGVPQIGVQQAPAGNSASQSETKQSSAELASRDEPATFKVNVKLVVVRAVVRDSQGHAIGNLRQDDFQVFDQGQAASDQPVRSRTAGKFGSKGAPGVD